MGSTSQLYSLSWGEFGSSLASAVQLLRGHGDLVDVTLAAGGRSFSAHKIVLSAASPFLLDLLKSTPCQHPVVMLAGIGADDLESILEFVYRGEVSVEPSQLPSLLQAAHCLSIHGLTPPTILTEKGEEVPVSTIPGCNETSISRDTMNSYLPQRRRKKKRKLSSGAGKWPKIGYHSSLETRSLDEHSEENRSVDFGHKDGDDGSHLDDEGDWNSKSRTLSDQPATCPLCGAIIRQSRNLRRHLELLHFGIGSGCKSSSGIRIKRDKPEKGLFSKSPTYSRVSLPLKDNVNSKSDATDYSTIPSLNLSSAASSNTSNLSIPGSFMLSGSSALGSNDHGHHHGHVHTHSHNNNPAHLIPSVSCPPSSSMAPPNNGIYSSDSASMLSCLLPTLPSLPTLSSQHDMFRHTEFLRANMGYSQDPSRQQHTSRHLQRTDVT
ncbi:PREDICTED: uncharacterized protein LOC105364705 isoform X2 [Ceratosolen solmsi marchali]|nr:PREDICTED: uncharacterized protein LOC105364705 isoform X2 [Ceratosolen solmsi marchali]XP_011501009.1 PREDICTED: uncharacterized protein LOC105364705 isoform X2 [Ceratosolen solmsi marchali]XP_011501010.1 PREDICTED: uncharacterized protein LOC105364705 isoform X2 [Ceratosolen solmsi marchali]